MVGTKRAAAHPLPEETAFPRSKRASARAKDAEDVVPDGYDPRALKKRKASLDDDSVVPDTFTFSKASGRAGRKHAEVLTAKTLVRGTKVWAAVAEVSSADVVLSLPHGRRGRVVAEDCAGLDAGDDLSNVYYVGQLVRAVVTEVEDKKVALSLKPSEVNAGLAAQTLIAGAVLSAAVVSAEDHGYQLDIGVPGVSAFLTTADARAALGEDTALQAGQLLDVVTLEAAQGRRAVRVSVDAARVWSTVLKEWEGLSIGSLVPGSLVNVKVTALLPDGVAVDFLSYFSGTVDVFHLSQEVLPGDWTERYQPGTRLRARILFVNQKTKKVGLTLQRSLVDGKLPASFPALGQIFEEAVVRRVDRAQGLLVELPGAEGGVPFAGYVPSAHVSDDKVEKLEKAFRSGQRVACRVVGFRPMDALCTVSLKASVLRQTILSAADLAPGMMVTGKVASVMDYGMLVELAPGVRALCPLVHLADVGWSKAARKYKEGQAVSALVTECRPESRQCFLTLKRTLIKSKLPRVAALEDALPGTRTHGVVTGIKDYGVFVALLGGVRGLVHRSELDVEAGEAPEDCFEVGQVVKCRILGAEGASRRLRLSLRARPGAEADDAEPADGGAFARVDAGAVLRATVREVDADGVVAALETDAGEVTARIPTGHLSDHPAMATQLREALQAGDALGDVLVLDCFRKKQEVLATRKASLVQAAERLPRAADAVSGGAVFPGYVHNATDDACYVRFLGRLTGRAVVSQCGDVSSPVAKASDAFRAHQSVICSVGRVEADRGRLAITLRPGLTRSSDATLLRSFYEDQDVVARLRHQHDAEEVPPELWRSQLALGRVVHGTVRDVKDYGAVVDMKASADVVGLLRPENQGGKVKPGKALTAVVLDYNAAEGRVDLSTDPDLVKAAQGKSKRAKPAAAGLTVSLEVVMSTSDYCIARSAEGGASAALVWVQTADFNTLHRPDLVAPPEPGSKIQATMTAEEVGGRPLALLVHKGGPKKAREDSAKKPRKADTKPGSVVKAVVTGCHATHADVELSGGGGKGRVHACEVSDKPAAGSFPVQELGGVGAGVEGCVMGLLATQEGRAHNVLEISMRASAVASARAGEKLRPRVQLEKLREGKTVWGVLQEHVSDGTGGGFWWVAVSPTVRGRLDHLDAAPGLSEFASFGRAAKVGMVVHARVARVDARRGTLDLTRRDVGSSLAKPQEGDVRLARVVSIKPGVGATVQLGHRLRGRLSIADVCDAYLDDPLQHLSEGATVQCCVLEVEDGGNTVHVSCREAHGGSLGASRPRRPARGQEGVPEDLDAASLQEGQTVQGWVKSVSTAGAFVTLARGVVARVKLCNLALGFVKEPAREFPPGRLVAGRVLSVDAGARRVELDLRGRGGEWLTIEKVEEGAVVPGTVKRVEKFGVFVLLDNSELTGLAHISECHDGFVKSLDDMFKVGQKLRAKVIKVDRAANKLSLSLREAEVGAADGADASGGDEDLDQAMLDADADSDSDIDALQEASESEEEGGLVPMSDSDEDEGVGGSEGTGSGEDDSDEEQDIDAMSTDGESEDGTDGSDEGPVAQDMSEDESSDDESVDDEEEDAEEAPKPAAGFGALRLAREDDGAGGDGEEAPAVPEKEHKSKGRKKAEREERERAVREAERAKVDGAAPASETDFEQLVLASPNSSYVWIRYMAFLCSVGEVDKARKVADRALEGIDYREEEEKFNVWAARINLEAQFGQPPGDAAMALFRRALPYCEPKKLHLLMLGVLQRVGDEALTAELLRAMCKKFRSSCKVWLRHIEHLLGQGEGEAARGVLQRALQALPRRKHVKCITQAALLEFRLGSPERARGMFEGILRNYPKRTDLWSVYLDQEVKQGDQARTRALFDRATALGLPPKKMKFLFKKYLDYERKHGDAASAERVKAAAMEYIAARAQAA
ncbi:unnamed protein product [Pedinophyceae sp. YPF-701]|nr:unnamed protein product [Pedinophyceae sp. YPF-701]